MQRRYFLMTMSMLPLAAALSANATPSFRIGVAPHSSARVIIKMYQPLRQYLEKALGQPVEIVTATDFTEFARRAAAQQYDIAITTGHQARFLQTDAAYLPLLTYAADFLAVALVAKDSAYHTPADLAGTTAYGLSPTSLVTLWGRHWLQRNGVPNVTLKYVSASDSTARLVINGDGSVAFHSLANYQNLPEELRAQLRILDQSLPMVGRVYMLNGRHRARHAEILDALWAFSRTEAAERYFAHYRLGGYRALGERELMEMEPFANEVRKQLRAP